MTAIDSNTGQPTITFAGSANPVADVAYLASYIPVVNDQVALLVISGDMLVIGKLGALSAAAIPTFRASLATAQPVPNITGTVIKYDTVDEDSVNGYSTSTGIYTVQRAGLYVVTAAMFWATNTTGERGVEIVAGSSHVDPSVWGNWVNAATAPNTESICVAQERFSVGDTLKVQCYQSSGGTLNTGTGSAVSVAAAWIAP